MKSFHSLKIELTLLIILSSLICVSQNNITITDVSSHNADGSAVLDIYSTSKGMLVPRMNTVQIGLISNPATGLLVFNTDINSFYFHNGVIWQSLSDPGAEIWGINQSTGDVYLTDLQTNIGIGTDTPLSKLALVANSGANPDDPLFEILDEFGNPIFSVTSEGVRIYVKDNIGKGVSGGFAVGRYGAAKGIPDTTYLLVTPDSTRVYSQDGLKGVSGGFAVGRYGAAKGTNMIFYTGKDSTRVYTDVPAKGVSGGFAVGRYGAAKSSADNYIHVVNNNAFIGFSAGLNTSTGTENIFIGKNAGIQNTSGSNNVFIGNSSGSNASATGMIGNVFIGNQAGAGETGSDKLYISNNSSDINGALIYGDFSAGSELLNLNGNLRFNKAGNTISMPATRGNSDQVLTSNGLGNTSWQTVENLMYKRVLVTPDEYFFEDGDQVYTLIMNGNTLVNAILPKVDSNVGRVIIIKNAGQESPMEIISQEGNLEGEPILIFPGVSYTFQASIDDNMWYIINSYIP